MGQRQARVHPKLGGCGPSEVLIQQMLAMLEKIDGADAEQADAILACVRTLYSEFTANGESTQTELDSQVVIPKPCSNVGAQPDASEQTFA